MRLLCILRAPCSYWKGAVILALLCITMYVGINANTKYTVIIVIFMFVFLRVRATFLLCFLCVCVIHVSTAILSRKGVLIISGSPDAPRMLLLFFSTRSNVVVFNPYFFRPLDCYVLN